MLEEYFDLDIIKDLKKYNLDKEVENIINSTGMINIDVNDLKTTFNNKKIVAYYSGIISDNLDDIKLNIIEECDSELFGIVNVNASFNMKLTFVDKVIEKINSYYKNHISTILGVNIDSNINGYKILAIICKKIA